MTVALREHDADDGIPARIGPYKIRQELGRGGMGIVYLARDPKLDRAVAIKVLSDSFADDPERLARFEREARLLASLSHPRIATIHGLEDDGPRRFITLEYVEGETLADRLERGALPIEDAIDLCAQIADALESAHENGVIHRDLKPGNVKIRPSGEVKVLDFGLAKGMTHGPGEVDDSQTITVAPTGVGVILGTAAYMSPEQARGKPVDRRADIWSFGCVLYECLTGRQAFEGETASDTIARILVQEPDWSAVPAGTPETVAYLLHRCLEKDPKRRLRDIGEARLALQDAREHLGRGTPATPAGLAAATWWARLRPAALALTALLAVAGLAAGAVQLLGPARRAAAVGGRYALVLPTDIRVRGVIPTRDGSAYVVTGKPRRMPGGEEPIARVYVRRADDFELRPLAGTEGVSGYPFPTRDSREVVFVAPAASGSRKLKLYKTAIDGGSPPIALADWNEAWQGIAELSDGDFLILTDMGKSFVVLPAKGGAPGAKVKIDAGAYTGRFEAVPNGAVGPRALLVDGIAYGPRGWVIGVAAIDPVTGKAKVLVEEGGSATVAPTGHLLFTRGDVLHAVRFDPRRVEVQGEPEAILSDVRTAGGFRPGHFHVTRSGTLLYGPGGRVGERRQLMTIDARGEARPLTEERKAYSSIVAVAPGGRVAVAATNSSGLDEIWIHEPGRDAMRLLVSMPADCNFPIWAPDGQRVGFYRYSSSPQDGLYVQHVAGGAPRRIFKPEGDDIDYLPWSWSPDGRSILFTRTRSGNSDVWSLPLGADGNPSGKLRPLIATPAMEFHPAWSPDGKWVAFTSDETGKNQIFVAPARADGGVGSHVAVTRGRGLYPRWTSPTRLVYYDELLEKGMAITLDPVRGVAVGEPSPVLDHRSMRVNAFAARSDHLVAVQRSPEEDDAGRYHVVLDWLGELAARAPSR